MTAHPMRYPSYIELSKSALEGNIQFLKKMYGETVRISSVVKANAYGHGISEFVPLAEACGIDHFSVFSMDEALHVKKFLKNHADIMVMGWTHPDDLEWAIENGIELYIYEYEMLTRAILCAEKTGKKAIIHLEIETGMNRTGLTGEELKAVRKLIRLNSEFVHVRGLCTHFAGAESISNFVRIQSQIRHFNRTRKWLSKNGIMPDLIHTACSAASVAYPQTRYDMVRVGILQYGFWPSPETFIQFMHGKGVKDDPLNRVISWKSNIMSVKDVNEGEFVSYGNTYLAKSDIKIAVIPTGYSHGYSRSLSNQGRVLIHGQRVGVVGLVNMNMLITDVTGIHGVKIGDEVVFIGRQNENEITVGSFVEFSDQMNYELLARLPQNIPRFVVD
ncbi:MAG: alanine racemase [Bacteroidales bacterium]|nr:alanine racemase [Bacteroidales bacterium]